MRLILVATASAASTGVMSADLTVSAAASLTDVFKAIAPLFDAAHPGTRVQFNFAASGALLQQIAKGAPVDVFVSADTDTMDEAQAKGLVRAGQRRNFAANALVVIVPSGRTPVPRAVADLVQPAYARIAIGWPASVPVGRYTRRVLDAAGLWGAVEPKTIGASNVRQVLDYVARSEVDAGFVYATDAVLVPGKVSVAFTVPTLSPILYPAAPVVSSPQAAAARAFVDFLGTPAAQSVLARYGFGKP